MKAIARLQQSIMFQAAAIQEVHDGMSASARRVIATGLIAAAAAIAANPAQAQSSYASPSACAGVGAAVGAVVGGNVGGSRSANIVGGILGAFGGGVLGNALCDDSKSRSDQAQGSSYNSAALGGGPTRNSAALGSYSQPQSSSHGKVALSYDQSRRLDEMTDAAMSAKEAWLQAARSGSGERDARIAFETKRATLSIAVANLTNPKNGPPRDVSRYSGIAGALMELPTEGGVTYRDIAAADKRMRSSNTDYSEASKYATRKVAMR